MTLDPNAPQLPEGQPVVPKASRFVASDEGTFVIEDPDEGEYDDEEPVTEGTQEGTGTGPEAIKRILAEWEEYP